MKQKLLLLLTLLCTMTGSAWAEDEVLLSYQMDNENYAAQTELAAGNGTIYFGADKRYASDYAAQLTKDVLAYYFDSKNREKMITGTADTPITATGGD